MESLVKLDSKGRILIPVGIRRRMSIQPETELILVPGKEGKDVRVVPISNEKTVKCSISISNSTGSLLGVMEMLEMLNVDVIMSESRNVIGNGISEWRFLLDTSKLTEKLKGLEDRLVELEGIKSVKIAVK